MDTDNLTSKRFEAIVVTKKISKGNRTRYGTIGPHRFKKAELEQVPKAEEPDLEEEFQKLI